MTDTADDQDRDFQFWQMKFTREEERDYQTFRDVQSRLPRTGLFLFVALGFGLAPLYQQELFRPSDTVLPVLTVIEFLCVTPVALIAAALSFFAQSHRVTRIFQGAAVLASLAGVIVLRNFALRDELDYPAVMIGVIMIAIVFFGQFSLFRIVPIVGLASMAAIIQEFELQSLANDPYLYSYALLIMAIVSLFGAYSQDMMARWNWRSMVRLRNARTELQESEERYRFMAESSPDQVWTATPEGKLDFVNHEAVLFTGYTAEELQSTWKSVIHPTDLPGYQKHWGECLRTGDSFEEEFRVQRSDGVYRWCLGRAILYRDKDGQPVKWFGTTVDVDDIWKAREAAEAATQVKAAFMANMSHEIRTPMNAIIGMTSILLDSKQTPEQKEWTEIIRHSGEHLLEIINDILDFSKIEAGKIELESRPFSLRECIESVLDLVAVDAAQKIVELGYLMQKSVPEGIEGDISRVRQILLNLVSNAVKFTPAGGQITVEVSAQGSNVNSLLHFVVKDTGIGISPEQRKRLFQPFSQADSSTTRMHGGTGLGLSISKRLVELMDGRIWVESEPGMGSSFHFTIRAPAADLDLNLTPETQVAALRGRRVLIVDDVEVNRRLLTHYAGVWGMESRHADNANDALHWLEQGEDFDLALLDYHMPGMDGLKLADSIRRLRSADRLPIVILSSVTLSGVRSGAVTASLQKPIKPSNLLSIIYNVLKGTPDAAPEEKGSTQLPTDMGKKHPLRILIAEDNAVNQKVAQLLFRRIGYETDAVADGQEALDALERQTYDVIFMDIQMPVMDGLAATRELCERYVPDTRPRIVGMSANATAEDRTEAIRAGMDDYVIKPVTARAVISALERCTRLP